MFRINHFLIGMLIMLIMALFTAPAFADFSVATGKPTLSYHTKQFKFFKNAVKRLTGDKYEVDYAFPEKGTDGTKQNIRLVNVGEDANVGFIQYDGMVVEKPENVTAFGPCAYELGNYVYKKGSKYDEIDDTQTKKAKVGVNSQSGSAITLAAYGEVDGGFKKSNKIDTPRGSIAMVKMNAGEIDGYFWVSTPGTATHKRFLQNESFRFGHCWDSDFDEFEINGAPLYEKVKLGKKLAHSLGFGKQKIITHTVPMYIIVNNKLLEEDENLYDLFIDVAAQMYQWNKAVGNNKDWYPR